MMFRVLFLVGAQKERRPVGGRGTASQGVYVRKGITSGGEPTPQGARGVATGGVGDHGGVHPAQGCQVCEYSGHDVVSCEMTSSLLTGSRRRLWYALRHDQVHVAEMSNYRGVHADHVSKSSRSPQSWFAMFSLLDFSRGLSVRLYVCRNAVHVGRISFVQRFLSAPRARRAQIASR